MSWQPRCGQLVAAFCCLLASASTIGLGQDQHYAVGSTSTATERAIEQALSRFVSFEADGVPIRELPELLAKRYGVPATVDYRALDDAGLGLETQSMMQLQSARLSTALKLMLAEHGLTFLIDDDRLVITSKDEADARLTTVVYDVANLLELDLRDRRLRSGQPDRLKPAVKPLSEAIMTFCAPTSWDEVGGVGSLYPMLGTLVITQTDHVHDQIRKALTQLRRFQRQRGQRLGRIPSSIHEPLGVYFLHESVEPPSADDLRDAQAIVEQATRDLAHYRQSGSTSRQITEHEARVAATLQSARANLERLTAFHKTGEPTFLIIRRMIDQPTKFAFDATPLDEVAKLLSDQHRIDFAIEYKSLEDAAVSPTTPITLKAEGVSLRTALEAMLRPLGLTWIVVDEVVLITSHDEADVRTYLRAYDISDLLQADLVDRKQQQQTTTNEWRYTSTEELILRTAAPHSWDVVGGPGAIIPMFGALLIDQTEVVHDQIVQLLYKLRQVLRRQTPERYASFSATQMPQAAGEHASTMNLRLHRLEATFGEETKRLASDAAARFAKEIQESIEPTSWQQQGGAGSVRLLTAGGASEPPALLIRQSDAVQRLIQLRIQQAIADGPVVKAMK